MTHVTRRSGRPYVLVLRKTEALFERAAAMRRKHQQDLEWLQHVSSHRDAGSG